MIVSGIFLELTISFKSNFKQNQKWWRLTKYHTYRTLWRIISVRSSYSITWLRIVFTLIDSYIDIITKSFSYAAFFADVPSETFHLCKYCTLDCLSSLGHNPRFSILYTYLVVGNDVKCCIYAICTSNRDI